MVVVDETIMVFLSFIDEEEDVKELKSKRQNKECKKEGEFGNGECCEHFVIWRVFSGVVCVDIAYGMLGPPFEHFSNFQLVPMCCLLRSILPLD